MSQCVCGKHPTPVGKRYCFREIKCRFAAWMLGVKLPDRVPPPP